MAFNLHPYLFPKGQTGHKLLSVFPKACPFSGASIPNSLTFSALASMQDADWLAVREADNRPVKFL
jgi:hypothetical protein